MTTFSYDLPTSIVLEVVLIPLHCGVNKLECCEHIVTLQDWCVLSVKLCRVHDVAGGDCEVLVGHLCCHWCCLACLHIAPQRAWTKPNTTLSFILRGDMDTLGNANSLSSPSLATTTSLLEDKSLSCRRFIHPTSPSAISFLYLVPFLSCLRFPAINYHSVNAVLVFFLIWSCHFLLAARISCNFSLLLTMLSLLCLTL